MNRAERRKQKRNGDNQTSYVWHGSSSKVTEDKPPVNKPGINCPPEFPEFDKQVESNVWHDRSELDEVLETIKKLSVEDDYSWSWSRNWNCKYINLRIDMRDGGFVLTNDKGRINLEQLKWQYDYKLDKDENET